MFSISLFGTLTLYLFFLLFQSIVNILKTYAIHIKRVCVCLCYCAVFGSRKEEKKGKEIQSSNRAAECTFYHLIYSVSWFCCWTFCTNYQYKIQNTYNEYTLGPSHFHFKCTIQCSMSKLLLNGFSVLIYDVNRNRMLLFELQYSGFMHSSCDSLSQYNVIWQR